MNSRPLRSCEGLIARHAERLFRAERKEGCEYPVVSRETKPLRMANFSRRFVS
jgi:hypothetical protein